MKNGQLEVSEMAGYRVKGYGNIGYCCMEFSPDEILHRRSYMRRILKETPFANRSNNQINGMRLWPDPLHGGYFVEDEEGYEYLIPDKKVSKEDAEFRKVRAMMPAEFMNLTGKDFRWDMYGESAATAKDIVNNYISKYETLQEKGMGLYIFSQTKGSGKTMLSCCILNELSKRYVGSVKFINALDLLEMTKKSFKQEAPIIDGLYVCRVLVIDDIGVQLDKEWVDTVFYHLINDRYRSGKVTIYTSNIAINDLKMDDRIVDRIESTSFEVHLPEVPLRSIMRKAEKEKLIK